jgi:hypothetical protein
MVHHTNISLLYGFVKIKILYGFVKIKTTALSFQTVG